ncbi:hypothetical protein OHV05_37555 (plasmid) [Kitasatospora sp. NBC_00070]|uniref:hypothetical protein n=1 Tax=Kitasatospora sp. NBC_00070 TaxID=2975962 RepID=UPI002F90E8FE
MTRAAMAGDRYEARQLPPVGNALPLWGAWDRRHRDWVRRLGTGAWAGEPEPFTSEDRVRTWATQQITASRSRA